MTRRPRQAAFATVVVLAASVISLSLWQARRSPIRGSPASPTSPAPVLEAAPAHAKVLHPLPRVNEISPDVDATPHAGYFEQARNGVSMRQALILDLLDMRNTLGSPTTDKHR